MSDPRPSPGDIIDLGDAVAELACPYCGAKVIVHAEALAHSWPSCLDYESSPSRDTLVKALQKARKRSH